MPTIDDALVALQEHFGFEDFREGQREVIASILEGRNSIVVMPTGSGKSLCYQLPALMREGATLVVSPLIALMKDQVDALEARGLPVTFINSSIPPEEQRTRINRLRAGEFRLVYIAPERFRSQMFTDSLRAANVSLFAVDEAHCISSWGHDFRPDYLRLKSAIEAIGHPQVVALTATATPYVRKDIVQQLGLTDPDTFVSGFDRPNLAIDVVQVSSDRQKISVIKKLARATTGSGIVYAATRKAVEQVERKLREAELSVVGYHAGMGDAVRMKAQDAFMSGRAQIIVATNAFGMGIDKADIRFVAHYQMPGSIEAYYQEIGRAGRDGLLASCALLFSYADKNTHDFFIDGSHPTTEMIRNVYDALLDTGLTNIELSPREIAARSGLKNDMAANSALNILERAGHIGRTAPSAFRDDSQPPVAPFSRRSRGIVVLDQKRVAKLNVNEQDLFRRRGMEQAKLREIISFCYSERCFRIHILDYFGDHHHARKCDLCGNCGADVVKTLATMQTVPRAKAVATASGAVDDFEFEPADVAGSVRQDPNSRRDSVGYFSEYTPRALTDDEELRVRKMLACVARMKGRFGKALVAATLRGSQSKEVLKFKLDQLSTHGLLADMTIAEIQASLDLLIAARCLMVSSGLYPIVSLTQFGEDVMRQRQRVELPLPSIVEAGEPVKLAVSDSRRKVRDPNGTINETYALYLEGLSISEIAARRNLRTTTIEEHLADCISLGREFDVSKFVTDDDRRLIEEATAKIGTERLRPLRDALPEHISYCMIRFVIALQQLQSESQTSSSA